MILGSIAVTGCTSQIKVKPNELLSPAVGAMENTSLKTVKIAVSDFSLKTGKGADEIGEAKTGVFNMPTPIKIDEPANLMVSNAIKRGLSYSGFQVVGPEEADRILDGSVEEFWVDEYATGYSMEYAKARVRYDVILKDRTGKSMWAKTIEKFMTSVKSMDATDDDIPTLKRVLNESVAALLEDPAFWAKLK